MGGWRLLVSLCALVVALGAARAAHAESEKERQDRARALSKEGQSRYDLGKFDEAITLFEASYEVWPFPVTLYNLGQTWRQKGDAKKALFYYRAYLRNEPDAPNRAYVEARIKELEKIVQQQEAVKEKPPEGTQEPTTQPAKVPPPALPPPAPRVDAPRTHWYGDWVGWSLAVGGAGPLGVGTWALLDAERLEDDAEGVDDAVATELYDKASERRWLGGPLTIVGAGLLTAGIWKLAVHDDAGSTGTTVGIGPNGIFVAGTW
jgi:tetratricopeptide (TPR) repeat protein